MRDASRLLGTAVRAHRNRRGFSQEELAFRSGLHRTYITDIEGGTRNPSLESIVKLALADLFASTGLPTKSPPDATRTETEQLWSGEHDAEILLVEDDPNDAELAVCALKECNFINRIHIARDGAEALDFIFGTGTHAQRRRMGKRPQVVLLDLKLPKVNGLEVLRRIKSDPRTRAMPVVVLTGSRLGKDLEESRRLGARDYIIKPVDFEKFSPTMPRLGFHWLLLK